MAEHFSSLEEAEGERYRAQHRLPRSPLCCCKGRRHHSCTPATVNSHQQLQVITRVNHSLQLHLSGNQSHISSPTSAKRDMKTHVLGNVEFSTGCVTKSMVSDPGEIRVMPFQVCWEV